VTRRRTRERCASPTSATDFRPEHPTDCPIPGCVLRRAPDPRGKKRDDVRGPTLGQWPPMSPQVKLRLTANLQLQPCRNPSRSRVRSGYPDRPIAPMSVMLRGPGGASIECSSALHLPTAALSTACRACDVASDALCRDPARRSRAFRFGPSRQARQAPPPLPSRQRRPLRRYQDAFPRRVLTLSPSEHEAREARPNALRGGCQSRGLTWSRWLSSTSATSDNPRAQPRDRPIPAPASTRRAQLALDWEETLRMGLKPSALSISGAR